MEAIAGPIIGSVVGGLLGGDEQTQTQERKMDPRMDKYVYGANGDGGLLGTAYSLMQKQMKTGGLNPLQQAGMEMQRQFLMSPQYQQGYGNMMSLGQSLMGAGVAGNPFMQGMGMTRARGSNMPMLDYTGGARPNLQYPSQQWAPEMNPVAMQAMQPMSFAPVEMDSSPLQTSDSDIQAIVEKYLRENGLLPSGRGSLDHGGDGGGASSAGGPGGDGGF